MATIDTTAQSMESKIAKTRGLEDAIRSALKIVDDVNREGLFDTPRRWAAMMEEMTSGHEFNFTTFKNEGISQMIIQSGIPFYSLCEHHLVCFFGQATVAYIPDKKIVGLSKLGRTVEHFSKKLQVQERMTQQIANFIDQKLAPLGVGVLLKARHMCQEMRGIRKCGSETTTSCLKGEFLTKQPVRDEFMRLAGT